MSDHVEKLRDLIGQRLAADYAFLRIADIKVREDEDTDGFPLLWVDVIYDGELAEQDVRGLMGLEGKVRSDLFSFHGDALPVFSFIPNRTGRSGSLGSRRAH